jgi:hypothetical protein
MGLAPLRRARRRGKCRGGGAQYLTATGGAVPNGVDVPCTEGCN